MSYVIRHPSGQYVREWPHVFEQVKRVDASGYRRMSEARKVAAQIPGAVVEVR